MGETTHPDDIAAMKAELRATIAASQPDGTYLDADYARIHELIAALGPLTPTPSPFANQAFVESPWGLDYAQFGPRHTAGKPIRHIGKLSNHSFNLFPAVEVLQLGITQDIRVDGNHYNNCMEFATPDGSYAARRIVWGRYDVGPEHPQRYDVSFYAVELIPNPDSSPEELRERIGLEPDALLRRDLKPPRLHSNIVFCDDDMRINVGVMGGIYVLHRLSGDGRSVTFP